MNHPEVFLVVAAAENGVIGIDGRLPWHISADLRRFKALTIGKPMVMGRKTFESLPGLLEGRRHIVLTRDPDWTEEGAEVVHSVEEALHLANAPHVAVIGGAEVYALFLPLTDRIELTRVHAAPEGDAMFPELDRRKWREAAKERHKAEGKAPAFDWITLVRKEAR
jgi:dihydrofolate reductase